MMKSKTTNGAFTPSGSAGGGFLRLGDVLKRFPVSKTVWYDGIRRGDYPKPVKLSERTSAWRVSDIEALCERLGGKA